MWPRGRKAYTVESVRWLRTHGGGLREMTRPKLVSIPKGAGVSPSTSLDLAWGVGGALAGIRLDIQSKLI